MNRILALASFVLTACAPASSDPPAPSQAATLAFTHVNVVDVEHGRVLPDRTVLVAGDRISAVDDASRVSVPSSARVVEGRGGFLIPGLWDVHTHALWDAEVAQLFLPLFAAHGVTGIRDMGGDLSLSLATRERVRSGATLGPRIVAAGPILDGPVPVHPPISWAISTEADARRAVDSLAKAGVDFVKVYTLLPADAYRTIMAEASRRGLPVAGHAPASLPVVKAAEAGQRSIEHLREEIEPYCSRADSVACVPLFDAFRRNHTWQTPTLVVLRSKVRLDDPALVDDPRFRAMPMSVTGDWVALRDNRLRSRDASDWRRARAQFDEERWLTGALSRAGVPVLAGTDAGVLYTYPGSSLHDELALLVEAGLSPAEALRAATLNPARYFEATDSLGTVSPGRLADLVLLDANPLDDIRNTARIRAVLLGGRLLDWASLDDLLKQADRN